MIDSSKLNLSGIPFELSLLLRLLKNNNKEEMKEIIQRDKDKLNWDLFTQLAIHHRIYPSIYSKANNIGLPKAVIKNLNNFYKKNIYHMMHLSAETENLAKLFHDKKISVLFLKGPVLAQDLYGDLSLRTSGDLDLLVQIKDLDKADRCLTKLGYIKDNYIHTVLNDWTWRHHHFTYFHPEKRIKTEIHWRLNPGPAKEPTFQELYLRKRSSQFSISPVYLLSKEDLFLFLVSHGARHGWSRLRWLADIDRMLCQGLDVKKTIQLLKKFQYLHTAGQAILLTFNLFQTPLTEELNKVACTKRSMNLAQQAVFYFKKQINLHIDPVPEDVARYHKRHLFTLMSWHQKLLFLISMLYPYPVDAETLPLPKPFHFLYFPLHPILWAWRKVRKQSIP